MQPINPAVRQAIERYISYNWGNAIILELVRFRFNMKLKSKCINSIRTDTPCTKKCLETCMLKDDPYLK